MLDGRQRGWNFPYFIGANAVESPLNLHVETGPSVMRITKPGKRYTGSLPINLHRTRSNADRCTITDNIIRLRYTRSFCRAFIYFRAAKRSGSIVESNRGRGGEWQYRHSFDLSCEKLYEFPFFILPLAPVFFGLLAFLLFGFVSILCFATRYGHKRVGFVGNSVDWRGNVILTYCCNFVPVWKKGTKKCEYRKARSGRLI